MAVWKNIGSLFLTNKRTLALVVFISLLSTGANLVEPLVYREAINDISGLFVQKAKDEATQGLTDSTSMAIDSTNVNTNDVDASVDEDALLVPVQKEKHSKYSVAPRTPE